MRKHNHFVMLYFSKTQISVCGDVDDDAIELKCEKRPQIKFSHQTINKRGEFIQFELAIFEDQLYIIIVQMKNTHPFLR